MPFPVKSLLLLLQLLQLLQCAGKLIEIYIVLLSFTQNTFLLATTNFASSNRGRVVVAHIMLKEFKLALIQLVNNHFFYCFRLYDVRHLRPGSEPAPLMCRT